MRYLLLTLAFAGSLALGADDDLRPMPAIHLPQTPVLVEPLPGPSVSDPIDTIALGQLYVVESSIELVTLQALDGILNLMPAKGPLTAYGLFADGTGKPELRTYSSNYLLIVSGVKPGKEELILIPASVMTGPEVGDVFKKAAVSGVLKQSEIIDALKAAAAVRQVLTVSGEGPKPPPDVDPVDPIDPTPIPTVGKLRIVIIEDPQARASIPSEQIAVMDGQDVRQYAKSHCTSTANTPDFRLLSKSQDVSLQPEWIKAAFAEPRPSLPFIVVSNGVTGASGPLPKTIAETLTLLKKYGGE